jgi:protein gp37
MQTKRSSLLMRYLAQRYPASLAPAHIWLGVSVKDARDAVRINHLRAARASVKFVSFEPLIGPVGEVDLTGIDWAIVGGESGPRARVMAEEWALELRDRCRALVRSALRLPVAFLIRLLSARRRQARIVRRLGRLPELCLQFRNSLRQNLNLSAER